MARGNSNSASESKLPVLPTDRLEIENLYAAMCRGKAKLVAPDGEERVLPKTVYAFLAELIGLLNEGKCVSILQKQTQLTTVEAASMLGVSRQFLVNMLEKGELPYHLVGTHRRIYAQDLLQYKAKRDQRRRKVLADLVQAEVKEGLYDRTLGSDED